MALNDVVGHRYSPEQGVMVIIIYSGAKGMSTYMGKTFAAVYNCNIIMK